MTTVSLMRWKSIKMNSNVKLFKHSLYKKEKITHGPKKLEKNSDLKVSCKFNIVHCMTGSWKFFSNDALNHKQSLIPSFPLISSTTVILIQFQFVSGNSVYVSSAVFLHPFAICVMDCVEVKLLESCYQSVVFSSQTVTAPKKSSITIISMTRAICLAHLRVHKYFQ